jgi:hypothetical protein
MYLTKEVSSRAFCSIIYIRDVRRQYDDAVIELSKSSDVYVYINKKSGIDSRKYASLLPVTGCIAGRKSEVAGMLEIVNYINKVIGNKYYSILIPKIDPSTNAPITLGDDATLAFKGNVLTQSVFECNRLSFESRSKIYTNKNVFPWIYNDYGMNSTHRCNGDMIITCVEMNRLLPSVDEDYLKSFDRSSIRTFIPSLFYKNSAKHYDLTPKKLMS